METIIRTMMDLIAGEVCGKEVTAVPDLPEDAQTRLYRLSKAHDLAHLVGNALIRQDRITDGELKAKFEKQIMVAVYRYEKINHELQRLCRTLNEAKIPFIPLKGAVIRQYYPEPWMRTSCDIDILVREEQVEEAAQVIAEKLGYTDKKKCYHDISLMSGSGVHLELHHSLREDEENLDRVLSACWDYAVACDGYEYRFEKEFFFFHQVAHACYHFLRGGCGVRPFLDIYLLERELSPDREALDRLLSAAGIRKFAETASALAEVWFGNREHTDVTRRMERFVLSGGVYGNKDNLMAIGQQSEKGQVGYVLHRIWLPYEPLCRVYPKLQGRRYLQPFYEIRRWFRVFDPKARSRRKQELDAIKRLDAEKKAEVNQMLRDLEML